MFERTGYQVHQVVYEIEEVCIDAYDEKKLPIGRSNIEDVFCADGTNFTQALGQVVTKVVQWGKDHPLPAGAGIKWLE
eukprot:12367388-Karenia_brevis.AAC.1